MGVTTNATEWPVHLPTWITRSSEVISMASWLCSRAVKIAFPALVHIARQQHKNHSRHLQQDQQKCTQRQTFTPWTTVKFWLPLKEPTSHKSDASPAWHEITTADKMRRTSVWTAIAPLRAPTVAAHYSRPSCWHSPRISARKTTANGTDQANAPHN